ncbi:MAG: cytidine deaminase [Microlunatus sp.]
MRDLTEPTDPEDRKIITLARAARARTGATEGASVRDTDGRTYAATSVALPSLQLSAVQVAVAMAVSSGVDGLEAVAVNGTDSLAEQDRSAIAELGGEQIVVWLTDAAGAVVGRVQL